MSEPVRLLDTNFDFPWPKPGDRLATSDGDPSYLVRTPEGEEWEDYVGAYKMAAEMLVERTHDMTLAINWLVFPIWYLYRHYLELRLKSLIWEGDAVEGKTPSLSHEKGHSVAELWKKCRPVIEKWCSDCPRSELDAVEEGLAEFNRFDPGGQAARYPTETSGKASGLLGIEINVKTFAERVGGIANFLDAVSAELSEAKSAPD